MKKTELTFAFEIPYSALTLGPKLGEGGFGTVYQATYLAAEAAVKQLKSDILTPQVKEEFLKETAIMAQLHHPNIIQLYGVCLQPYAIVMEYMPQGSLFSLIHSEKDLSWAQRYRMGIDIGKGVHFLHSKNIVHRDLKSLNVLVKPDCAKLCDFGLARVKTESSSTTTHKKSTAGPGTTRWKAPELFKRGQSATVYSDVYAYGVILWEMAARKIPYQEEHDDQTVISWIKDGEQETIPETAPKPYRQAIEAAWQFEASKRPTALALVEALKDGQTVLAEEENKANVLAPVKTTTVITPPQGPAESLSALAPSGPQYLSTLTEGSSRFSAKTSVTSPIPSPSNVEALKATVNDSGPQYVSQLPTQTMDTPLNPGKQEVTASGPQYLSNLSGLVDLSITTSTPESQPSPTPAHNLPLVHYQDTPEDLVKAAKAMLRAKEWSSEQKAYFKELIQTASLPPVQVLQGHTSTVNKLVLLPNGQLASGSWDKTIKIWDLVSGTCLKTLQGHTSSVNKLVLLPNNQLASESSDGTIKIWDLDSGMCLKTLKDYIGQVTTLVLLPNGQLASGSSNHTIKLWDLDSGTCLKTLQGHTGWVNTLLLLPNGQLASGSGYPDNTIKVWDLNDGTCLKTLQGHTSYVYPLVLLPNGQLASGSTDKTIKLWDLNNGTCLKTLKDHIDQVTTLVLLPNGQLASGSTDNTIKLWDLSTGTCLKTLTAQHPMETLRLLGNTHLLSISGGEIQWWRLDNGQCEQRYGGLTGRYIYNLLPLSSAEYLITLGNQIQRFSIAPNATLREGLTEPRQVLSATGHYAFFKRQVVGQLKWASKILQGHTSSVNTLVLLPNGQLASGSCDTTIKLWDLDSRTCLKTLQGHKYAVTKLVLLPNGQLASGSHDATIKLWDLDSGTCLKTWQGHTKEMNALVLLPNNQLASGSYDHTIKIWDLASGTCLKTLQGHTSSIDTLVALPNGQLASGSWDHTIKLWDLDSGTCLKTLQGHTNRVNTLLLLPNGQLASEAGDAIKLWDLDSGTCLQTLQEHNSYVGKLLLLPNGQLASGSNNYTIKLWDLNSGTCVKTLQEGHYGYFLYTLVLLPNGQLASGSNDNAIRLWDIDLKHTLKELEQKAPECKMM